MSKLAKFLSYYRPYRFTYGAVLIAALGASALALIFPTLVKNLLDGGFSGEAWRIALIMVAVIGGQTALTLVYDFKGHDVGAKMERDMRQELFESFERLPLSYFDNNKTGDMLSRLTNDLNEIAELCHHGPENIALYGVQFFGALVILARMNWQLTLVVCALLPVMIVYSVYFYRKMERVYGENRRRISDINARASENFTGIRAIKTFAAEKTEVALFRKDNQRHYESHTAIYRAESFFYAGTTNFFLPLVTVVAVVVGGMWVSGGSMELPELVAFMLYANYLTGPVPRLAFMVSQYQDGMSGYRRFREIADLQPEQSGPDLPDLKVNGGAVRFDRVTFSYRDDGDYVLKNLNLEVDAGETVAIVGRSGIGKTTLCSLIPRLYPISGGDILVDGQSVTAVDLNSLRRSIGVVAQETVLFSGSVVDNLLLAHPTATRDEVVAAATKAGAHDFIMSLKDGYDTDIGPRGVRLSGGQRQRLSIARVFLQNPPILIFDEATSALDYESERAVMEGLKTLSSGRTTFIIAHRLSTVRHADRIVVLTDEGIAETGTHDQLLQSGGIYADLYAAQG